jgi:hypothetical protein
MPVTGSVIGVTGSLGSVPHAAATKMLSGKASHAVRFAGTAADEDFDCV